MTAAKRFTRQQKNLKRDIAQLLTLDSELSTRSLHIPSFRHTPLPKQLTLRVGSVTTTPKDIRVTIDGEVEHTNHRHKRITVLEAKIAHSGQVEFAYVQDSTLDGKPVRESYQLHATEYVPARNEFFALLHDSLHKKDGLALIRSVVAKHMA